MVVNGKYFNDIGKIRNNQTAPSTARHVQANPGGFEKILQEKTAKIGDVKFSKHAELRLQSRNINLSSAQKEKLTQAVDRADAKGVKDSLVFMDNMAFVVNVKSRTVITAANGSDLKENVFTNIDGAVIV